MAVPYRILVIYVVVCLCPGPSWTQYAMLKKRDLKISVFNEAVIRNNTSICSGKLNFGDNAMNYFRYLQPLSNYLYVGAMNCLLRLQQADLFVENSLHFPVDAGDLWKCTVQGKKDTPDCQNHIRAVMPDVNDNDKLFVCGTGGYAPRKYKLSWPPSNETMNQTDDKEDGSKYCPFDPLDNITSIHVASGNLDNKPAHYFGLYGDFIKRLPVLFRPAFNVSLYYDLVSAKRDETWLNSPQFVGSFNVDYQNKGGQVFFFFREIAEEESASTKIFSRVAKVCRHDRGGGTVERNQKTWLSYQKARLNCSLPGFEPYYWDDIYDVYEADDKFYALFFKQGGDHNSSAICVYSKAEIFRVFGANFKYYNRTAKLWEIQNPQPRLDDCTLHDNNTFDGLTIGSRYQLMEQNVNSIYGRPIFSKTGIQFLKIAVYPDTESRASNIYLATDSGDVYMLFLHDCFGKSFELVENAILSPLDNPHPVWSMKLLESQNSLYLGTDYEVVKVSLVVCEEYKKKDSCVHDIRCKWCTDSSICRQQDHSCTGKTYKDIYIEDESTSQCPYGDLFLILDEEVSPIPQVSLMGLYITLHINYGLQRAGPTVWTKADKTISFSEDERFFLSSDGALIIRNVTNSDNAIYKAYDTVYKRRRKVAEYNLEVNEGTPDQLVEVWKQSFVDWSTAFRNWESCSSSYLEQCNSP